MYRRSTSFDAMRKPFGDPKAPFTAEKMSHGFKHACAPSEVVRVCMPVSVPVPSP